MSGLDSLLAAAPDAGLLPGFDYSIVPSSTAVVDRKQGKCAYPTSASSLSQSGTRTCRIPIGSDGFCDSSSVRLEFTINNLDSAKDMKFWAGPWGAWGTVRLLSQGTEIERVDIYGRHHELFGFQLLPLQDQWTEVAVCGLHGSWEAGMEQLQPKEGKIEKSERAIVMHKLHLSLFNSHKILPLRFCPLDLELTLAPTGYWTDNVSTSSGTTLAYSTNYSISDIKIRYDEVVPDESIVNSFYSGLLANQIMSVPVLCAHQFTQAILSSQTSVDITASRAFSKISSIWLTFSGDGDQLPSDLTQPNLASAPNMAGSIPKVDSGNPPWCPSVRLSIGGKNFPDPAPADSITYQYYSLIKALGYSPNITRDDFVSDTYALVFDMKRVPFDHGSGTSSRSGDLIRIEVKNLAANHGARVAHVTIFAYSVVAIRERGVSLLN